MWLSRLLFWRPPCIYREVIADLRDEPEPLALRGVLTGYRGSWLTLSDASLHRAAGPPTPFGSGGEVVIHRERVRYLQVIR